MNRTAGVPILAAVLGICAIGLTAAALPFSLPVAPYELPERSGGSGLSLIELILFLINLILAFLFGPGSDVTSGTTIAFDQLIATAVEFVYQWLPVVLVVNVLAIAVAAALSYTDRSVLSLAFLPSEKETAGKSSTMRHTSPWSTTDLSNDVYRAWFALVQSLSTERVESKTPAECAAIAVDRGFDREAVEIVRGEFERIRYGGHTLTDDREQRVRQAITQLGLDSENSASTREASIE